MKKYFAMLALGLAVAGTSYAQTGPQRERTQDNRTGQRKKDKGDFRRGNDKRAQLSPEERATKRTEVLSQKLDLSNSQQKKLQALNLKHAQQLESFKGQYAQNGQRNGSQRNDEREQLKQLHASWEKEFKSIVSKKQYEKYEAERKQMQANRGQRKGREEGKETRARRQQNG